MGIRTLLLPIAYVVAAVLKKLKVSLRAVIGFSFLVIFATVSAFYMVFTSALYSGWFELLTVAGIFLTGFNDELIREMSRAKRPPALPLALARHSDLLLVFGILYIAMMQPYGLVPSLNVGESAYPVIGAAMLIGVLVADLTARKIEGRDPGIESRAERMMMLTGFMLIGYYFNEFLLAIFVGLIGVTAALYMWILWTKLVGVFGAADSLYVGLSRLVGRASAGIKISGAKIPVHREGGGFQDYSAEEHAPGTGYNFTAVVNDRRSEPVPDAKVTLINVESGDTYASYTDPSGRASFTGASEGQYNITLECEGFKKMEYERYISMDSGEVFVLKRPFSDLSIVISDKKETTPVPNAKVTIGLSGTDKTPLRRKADNLGVVYFDELDIGTYDIYVKAAGYADWRRSVNLEEENVVSVTLDRGDAKAEAPEPAETEAEPPEPQEEEPEPPEEAPESPEEEPESPEEEPEPLEEAPELPEEAPEEEPPTEEPQREEAELADVLSESALFQYYLPDEVRPLVSKIVDEYRSHDIDIYLVSTPERAEEYRDLEVKIVDVPEEPDRFKDVLDGMPAGSVLIFEPLSNLIITGGFDAAYKFIKKTLKYMKGEGLTLACFVNPKAHEEKDLKKLRKLMSSVTIDGEKLYR